MKVLYFKIAFRYLLKNKLYSFINVFGLAIGITSFILIMMYVKYEYSYDTFKGSENVYRTFMDYREGDTFVPGDAMTFNLSGPTLQKDFPEVVDYVRFYYFEKVTFVLGDKVFEQPKGSMADHNVFEMFKYPLIKGDKASALQEPNTIVLTETLAYKLFGNKDPLQKAVSVFWNNSEVTLTVTGVMKDISENSHFKNTFLISYSTEKTWKSKYFGKQHYTPNWNFNNFYTYIEVAPNTDIASLRQKIFDRNIENTEDNNEEDNERHNIEAIQDIHLYSNKPYEAEVNGSASRVKFLTAIAFIVLILSWLNYINLSTTKSLERAKEIGIRKVVGAQKKQLILQSLLESIVLNAVAIVIALVFTGVLLPFYNKFTGKAMTLELSDFASFFPVFAVILLGMILSGLYPAIVLSNYAPSRALKGKIRTSAKGLHVRKSLIITQFLATIILIIGTIVVNKQIKFLQEQPVGVDLNQILSVHGAVVTNKQDSLLQQDFDVLAEQLNSLPYVEKWTMSGAYPGGSFDNISSSRYIDLPNGERNERSIYYTYEALQEYFDMMDMQFISGSAFIDTPGKSTNSVVVNEMFLKVMNIAHVDDIVDKTLKFWGEEWKVTGVIKDYHHFGLKEPVYPLIIRNEKKQ